MINKETIEDLLQEAVFAPSGDNSQPWWFRWDGNKLNIYLVPDRDNAILNYRLSGTHVAIGALIENIHILSAQKGIFVSMDLFPDNLNKNLVAKLDFTQSDTIPRGNLARYVVLRCTNRKPYFNQPVPRQNLEKILESVDSLSEYVSLRFLLNKKNIIKSANASSVMERVALETKSIHRLFFSSIIWSQSESINGQMGLPLKTTELPLPVRLLFRIIKHWPVAKFMNRIGLSRIAAKADAVTYASSPVMGLISVKENSPRSYVDAGRLMQRVWLMATEQKLSFHPVTGILFLGQRVQNNDTSVFHSHHIHLIKDAYNDIKKSFLVTHGEPAILFRLGFANKPSARTTRKKPEFR